MVIRGVARSAPARLAISLVVGLFILLLVSLLSSLLLGLLSGIAGMGAVFVLTGLSQRLASRSARTAASLISLRFVAVSRVSCP
jgi:hypothetical protein